MKKVLALLIAILTLSLSLGLSACYTKNSFQEKMVLGNTYVFKEAELKTSTSFSKSTITEDEEKDLIERYLVGELKETVDQEFADIKTNHKNEELYFDFDSKGSYYQANGGEKIYLRHTLDQPVSGKWIGPSLSYNKGYLIIEEDGSAFHYNDYSKSESFEDPTYGYFIIYININLNYEIKK